MSDISLPDIYVPVHDTPGRPDHAALEDLQRYPVLFCPHQEILTPQRAQLLEEYVRSGGTLVLGARTGQKDAQGHCVMAPMPGLLSGLTQTQVREFTFIGPADDPVPMEWDGKQLDTGIFNDVLETVGEDARVLANATVQVAPP